jgi:hypothetical protein
MAAIVENDQNIRNLQVLQPNGLTKIKSLVQRFAVCWEAHSEQTIVTVLDPNDQVPRVRQSYEK